MTIHDVIIAGAGPAGSALAIALAGEGYSVLLLDAARFPRDKPCGDFVSPKGLAHLDELGCGPAVRAAGCTPISRSILYLNRERLVAGTLPVVAGLPSHGLAVPRRELDEILYRRAVEAGAVGRESFRVESFRTTRDGVEVDTMHRGRSYRFTGRMLVGADGASSVVARVADLRVNDPRHTLASMRAYVHGLSLDHTVMYFDQRFFPGYGWVFPVREGLCNMGVGMVKEPLVRERIRLLEFYARFRRVVERLGRSRGVEVEIERHRGWPIFTYGGARKNYFDRGLLIGEAGGFVDPLNGEGIPLALETAHIAARTIRAAFRQGRFGEAVLAGYETEWRRSLDPDLGISDLVVSMIRNRELLPLWLAIFRAMSRTARHDRHYAMVTGGILGGVVPARQGMTPEMFVRALAHGPGFWRDVLGTEGRASWRGVLDDGIALLRWQSSITRSLVSNDPWFREWLREILAKQGRVMLGRARIDG